MKLPIPLHRAAAGSRAPLPAATAGVGGREHRCYCRGQTSCHVEVLGDGSGCPLRRMLWRWWVDVVPLLGLPGRLLPQEQHWEAVGAPLFQFGFTKWPFVLLIFFLPIRCCFCRVGVTNADCSIVCSPGFQVGMRDLAAWGRALVSEQLLCQVKLRELLVVVCLIVCFCGLVTLFQL